MSTLYKTKEVAKKMSVSEATVRNLIKSGELEAIKIGNDFRVAEEDIDRYCERNRVNAKTNNVL